MGRQEKALDPAAGPVASFAFALRTLRQEAGNPTYAVMARRSPYSVATLSRAAAGEQLPTLPVVLAYVAACGGDPEAFEARWRLVADGPTSPGPPGEGEGVESSPYRGLARFEPQDRELFFGRDRVLTDLVTLLREHRAVIVFGASGSGKSSVLRAGLVPYLRDADGMLPRPAAIRILTPGAHPLATHGPALLPADAEGDTWLIVDQFEELFTLCHDEEERGRFIDTLLEAADPARGLRVVLGVRADFYARCLEHPGLAAAMRDASLPVGRMTPAELRRVIVKPAAARGFIVERALTEALIEEVSAQTSGLPMLSHALLETWRRRRARTLTVDAYERAGGVRGAIAQSAEAAFGRMDPAQAETVRRIRLRLITPGDGVPDTRRPTTRQELVSLGADGRTDTVLELLARERLITLDESRVDLAHEALITAWPRLHGWIEQDRERMHRHRRLTDAARGWEALGRQHSALANEALLAALGDVTSPDRAEELNAVEAAFLTASVHARRIRRRRRTVARAALALLTVAAVLAGTVAWQQGRAGEARRTLSTAIRTASLAEGMRFTDPATAGRLSIAAWNLAQTPETLAGLIEAVNDRRLPDFSPPAGDTTLGSRYATLGEDGATVTVQTADRVERWDLRSGRRTLSYTAQGAPHPRPVAPVAPDRRRHDPLLPHLGPGGTRVARLLSQRAGAEDIAGPPRGPVAVTDPVVVEVRDTATTTARMLHPGRKADDPGYVHGLSWSSDDRFLGIDIGARAEVWDAAQGRLVLAVDGAQRGNSITLSPDGRWAAVCGPTGTVQVWDTAQGKKAYESSAPVQDARDGVSCTRGGFRLSQDGKTLAHRTDTGIEITSVAGARRPGPEPGPGEDGEGPGGTSSGEAIRQAGIVEFTVSADARFLAALTSDAIMLWRMDDPWGARLLQTVPVWDDAPRDLRIDTEQGVLRYLGLGGLTIRSLSVATSIRTDWEDMWARTTYLSPDGRHMVTHVRADGAGGAAPTGGQLLELRDVRDGHVLARLPAPPADATEAELLASISADGALFAYGPQVEPGQPATFTVWDVARRSTTGTTTFSAGEEQGLLAVLPATDPDPSRPRLFGVSADALWDLERAVRVHSFQLPLYKMDEGPWNPAATAHREEPHLTLGDGTVMNLDGRQVRSPHGSSGGQTARSPDGAHAAFADQRGHVSVWNARNGSKLGELLHSVATERDGPPVRVAVMAFSPDGRTLATGDDRGRVRLWDIASLRALGGAMRTPGDPVHALAFSPDGHTLYVKGLHTPLQRLPLEPKALLDELCSRLGEPLSRAQWQALVRDAPYRSTC